VEDPEEKLLELTLAISDGEAVDWGEVESRETDETRRELLDALRAISEIAQAHSSWQRSAPGDESVGGTTVGRGHAAVFSPGRIIAARYRVEAEVGAGGFGRVYRALDQRLGRHVALKALFSFRAGEIRGERAMRFLSEARTLARLEHRHIVPVYDAGIEAGIPWLTMKLIEGQSLAAVIAEQGPVAPERAVHLLSQVARALRHAHERGIVHRDIKPANVLVGREEDGAESIWLTDFGVAKLLGEKGASVDVHLVGTPFYMAPEQVTGRQVDARTDIFAFGCVAAELVTGSRLWKGDSLAEVLDTIVRELPDLTGVRTRARDDFAGIVRKCLAKSPEDRWQTVDELARALAGLTMSIPTVPGEPAPRRRLRISFWGKRQEAVWDERSPLVVKGLRKGYQLRKPVLAGLDLDIPRGAVYALLGRNGSGKSTLIRTCLGIYRRDGGEVRVFGRDPERERVAILARIGFVPDTLMADERFKVSELVRFVSSFYPRWDNAYCHRLLGRYDLDLDQRLRDLSRGQKTQVSLLLALSNRPDLLLLDDPTLGLDALVLEEFFAILEEVRREGMTILLASHNYEEIEKLATHVGLLKGGRLLLSESFAVLKERSKQVNLTFAEVAPDLSGVHNFRVIKSVGRQISGVILDSRLRTLDWLKALDPKELVVGDLSLRDIFMLLTREIPY
jgi:ABC-type multidrug transport system ATPase subunit/serine/threonine protein kinase